MSEFVVIDGERVAIPADAGPDEIRRLFDLSEQSSASASPTVATSETLPPKPDVSGSTSIDPDTLSTNSDWLASSSVVFKSQTGRDWDETKDGDKKALAEFGLDQMGWFNYNLPQMAMDAATVRNASPEYKQAFLHMMDTYDKLEMSWGGTLRFAKGVALDPTTYAGLTTLGIGILGGTATKIASKEALKQALRVGMVGAMEGAMFGAADNAIRQDVEISAGRRTETDLGEVAGAAAIGAGAGAVLGGALDIAGTGVKQIAKGMARDAVPDPVQPGVAQAAPTPAQAAPTASTASSAPTNALPSPTPEVRNLPAEIIPPTRVGDVLPPVKEGPAIDAPFTTRNPTIDAIREIAQPTGGRELPNLRNLGPETGETAVQRLLNTPPEELQLHIEQVRRMAGSPEERALVDVVVREATRQLDEMGAPLAKQLNSKDPAAQEAAAKALEEIDIIRSKLKPVDLDLSSNEGKALGARANNGLFNTGENRGLMPESFLPEGVTRDTATPEQMNEAEKAYYAAYDKMKARVQAKEEVRNLDREIQAAYESGDIPLAHKKAQEKADLVASMMDKESIGGRITKGLKSSLDKLNEYLISTVFSPSTAIVNIVPSILKTTYRPFMDYLVRGGPMSEYAGRQMVATYSAMVQSMGTAFRAARLAFRYEQAMLSRDGLRLLESDFGPAIKGTKGRFIRIIPRILGATDEFFSQVAYRGYVAGDAMAEGMKIANARGITDKTEINRIVEANIQARMAGAFEAKIDAPRVIEQLRSKGTDLGYKGDKLDEWIKSQLDGNEDLFRLATQQSGISYTEDLLFKRKFSGKSYTLGVNVSAMAQGYERAVNNMPILRTIGQLFFRTPVRVFEEGIKLTAGLNLLTPNMLKDLRGVNGPQRQIQAQGHMLMSYGIAMAFAVMYSKGSVTGGGPSDNKERRSLEDGKQWAPYSIRFEDGSSFSFRNLDPFATPFKIMANALDKIQTLRYREAQGEYVGKEMEKAFGWFQAGIGATAQAIKDASLTEGLDQLSRLWDNLANPKSEDHALQAWTKFFGQKATMAIPNTFRKAMAIDQPQMNDPASVNEYLKGAINPADPRVNKQHDALGNVRTNDNPWAGMIGLSMTTKDQKEAGKDAKDLEVNRILYSITMATGSKFLLPAKAAEYPGLDLRTTPTADGKTTLYNRWNELYSKSGVKEALYDALVLNKELPMGVEGSPAALAQIATQITGAFKKQALAQLQQEEQSLFSKQMENATRKNDALMGRREVPWQPFK
jgi:hypothetical protein